MTKYLITFPSAAMQLEPDEFEAVGADARRFVQSAKEAGVYVFAGGINEDVASVMVHGDGSATDETYPQTSELDGGFCVLELPTRDAAVDAAVMVRVMRMTSRCMGVKSLRTFLVRLAILPNSVSMPVA